MRLLREHAPADYADLPGPAAESTLESAERRMNISLPQELRAWLLLNNLDPDEEDFDEDVACSGFPGFPDESHFFLGIRSMEQLYGNHAMPGGINPPDQRENPFWRNEWVPFLSDQDGWAGNFVDVRDGRVGSWRVGEITSTGEYESLADFFDSVAHTLTKIAAGDHPICSVADGRLVWM
ncbi:SMI1/KNR4 family protein [Streptomyces sp. NBC_01341]|uniref:SMI1/KNR4 family protein n=1 Tax=Streptomyces sp. NBC_01341 TaxID=2903831 RepID=UPI002E112B85|nr:SMI1/KNR4 family protein [Streptomyces sp. NBC_01341]